MEYLNDFPSFTLWTLFILDNMLVIFCVLYPVNFRLSIICLELKAPFVNNLTISSSIELFEVTMLI